MSRIVYGDGCQVDEHSQLMLQKLSEADRPLGTGDLTKPAGFENGAYAKVRYRLTEHLLPSELVRETEPVYRSGQKHRRFEITEAGVEFVDKHRKELGAIPELQAVAEDAAEAKAMAESAKDSVQNYRTKLNRATKKYNDLTNVDLEEIEEYANVVPDMWHDVYAKYPIPEHDEKIEDLEEQLDELESEINSIKTDIFSLSNTVDGLASQRAADANTEHIQNVDESVQKLREEFEEYRETPTRIERVRGALRTVTSRLVSAVTLPVRVLPFPSRSQPSDFAEPSRSRSSFKSIGSLLKKLLGGLMILVALAVVGLSIYNGYRMYAML